MDQQPNFQQPNFQQPGYQPAPQKTNGKAVAALVCGILSLLMTWTGWFAIVGLILGIVGIVLAVLSKKDGKSGMATAGLVLSIIGTVLCGIFFVSCAICTAAVSSAVGSSDWESIADDINDALKTLQ